MKYPSLLELSYGQVELRSNAETSTGQYTYNLRILFGPETRDVDLDKGRNA